MREALRDMGFDEHCVLGESCSISDGPFSSRSQSHLPHHHSHYPPYSGARVEAAHMERRTAPPLPPYHDPAMGLDSRPGAPMTADRNAGAGNTLDGVGSGGPGATAPLAARRGDGRHVTPFEEEGNAETNEADINDDPQLMAHQHHHHLAFSMDESSLLAPPGQYDSTADSSQRDLWPDAKGHGVSASTALVLTEYRERLQRIHELLLGLEEDKNQTTTPLSQLPGPARQSLSPAHLHQPPSHHQNPSTIIPRSSRPIASRDGGHKNMAKRTSGMTGVSRRGHGHMSAGSAGDRIPSPQVATRHGLNRSYPADPNDHPREEGYPYEGEDRTYHRCEDRCMGQGDGESPTAVVDVRYPSYYRHADEWDSSRSGGERASMRTGTCGVVPTTCALPHPSTPYGCRCLSARVGHSTTRVQDRWRESRVQATAAAQGQVHSPRLGPRVELRRETGASRRVGTGRMTPSTLPVSRHTDRVMLAEYYRRQWEKKERRMERNGRNAVWNTRCALQLAYLKDHCMNADYH